MKLTKLFTEFFESKKAGGIILLCCTIVSITLANSSLQESYIHIWKLEFAGHHLEYWINDGLMTIFFLLIGLELEREIYIGELSSRKTALLPIFAALGGMLVPAGIYLWFNYGTPTGSGAGIPMATDIAFALGMLSLLGKRVSASLKIFLTALAVIDDLGAILTIAIFYSTGISLLYLGLALSIFLLLGVLNRFKVKGLIPYLIGGVGMWYCMLHSGVHATLAGVLLAFVIPFGKGDEKLTSYRLQHFLHKPVSFIILPIFALANTAIVFQGSLTESILTPNSWGIFFGLFLGKPLGIFLFSLLAVTLGICKLPDDMNWKQVIGIGFLGGIGFTMSIFITLLAFNHIETINASKITIIITSTIAAVTGLLWLKIVLSHKGANLKEENKGLNY